MLDFKQLLVDISVAGTYHTSPYGQLNERSERLVDNLCAPVRTYIVFAHITVSDAILPIYFHRLLVSSHEHKLTTTTTTVDERESYQVKRKSIPRLL
jgi:hypothetical protein